MVGEQPKLFKIDDVIERQRITKKGTFYKTYEIFFTTKSGVTSSVEVNKEGYTTEIGKAAAEKAAKAIENTFG